MEFGLFRHNSGKLYIGIGPFEDFAEPISSEFYFYVNDFELSDPKPWKKPSAYFALDAKSIAEDLSLLPPPFQNWDQSFEPPVIAWSQPSQDRFKMIFRRIRRSIRLKRFLKMVPVISQHGTLIKGNLLQLVQRLLQDNQAHWSYAWLSSNLNFAGNSPELLCHVTPHSLNTMALAGTAKPQYQKDFSFDVKEIQEHQFVVDHIRQQLSIFGEVKCNERKILQLNSLTHFCTPIELSLDENHQNLSNSWITTLHPTPALGCLPRNEEWLQRLMDYRESMKIPKHFGAPFGVYAQGDIQLALTIRGCFWQDRNVHLPTGCGIVAASAFDHEWRELHMKCESVMRYFNL
jgi:menaquinone-specific isochorismate synthase